MPANGSFRATSLDRSAAYAIPYFSGKTGTLWRAERVVHSYGPDPGFAICRIPLVDLNEKAPTIVTGDNALLKTIKLGMLAHVMVDPNPTTPDKPNPSQIIMTGRVTKIDPQIGSDTAMATISDIRYEMKALQMIGSFWRDANGSIVFRDSFRAHCNKGNAPNCIWVSGGSGLVPVFCPSWFGINTESDGPTAVPSANDRSTTKASYWTNEGKLAYIQYAFTDGASLASGHYPFYPTLPEGLNWDAGYADFVTQDIPSDRKLQECILDGMNCCDALTEVLRGAGKYALSIDYDSPTSSTVNIVRTRATGGGIDVTLIDGGKMQDADLDNLFVTDGSLSLSGDNLYTKAAAGGAPIYIETRVDTKDSGNLTFGWSDDEQTAVHDYVFELLQKRCTDDTPPSGCDSSTHPKYNPDAAIAMALQKHWNVFAAYRIKPTFDFQSGTAEAGQPRADINRPILPHLLSSYLTDPSGNNYLDSLVQKRSIQIETFIPKDEATPSVGAWAIADIGDGLAIDDDGTIWLTGLRAAGALFGFIATMKIYTGGGTDCDPDQIETLTINPRHVRMTVAIPCDSRLNQAVKVSTDPTGGIQVSGTSTDSDLIDPSLSRLYYADTNSLYAKEERHGSWPVPQGIEKANVDDTIDCDPANASQAPDQILRDDTQFCLEHAKRKLEDLGRPDKDATLICPVIQYIPIGTEISSLVGQNGETKINGVIRSVTYIFVDGQKSVYELN